MTKPTLYFDTNVISAYWYTGGDVAMVARRMHTREWWDSERKHFSLWTSTFAEIELQAGEFRRQHECLKMIRRLRYLTVTNAAKALMDEILERGLVLRGPPGNLHFPKHRLSLNLELCSHGERQCSPSRKIDLANPFAGGTMNDPILDEIARVRQELVKKHGGIDGYFRHVQELDRARRRKQKRKKASRKQKTKASR
jgi:hypothetical protein